MKWEALFQRWYGYMVVDVCTEHRCTIRSISFGLVSFDYGITNGQLELRS